MTQDSRELIVTRKYFVSHILNHGAFILFLFNTAVYGGPNLYNGEILEWNKARPTPPRLYESEHEVCHGLIEARAGDWARSTRHICVI